MLTFSFFFQFFALCDFVFFLDPACWLANIGHSKIQTAVKRVEIQKEIATEAKREVKKAEKDVQKLEADLARYKARAVSLSVCFQSMCAI